MHRERRERVEKARQDRLDALEKEIIDKQNRAERLRSERLHAKKSTLARFSRRPLGPDANTDVNSAPFTRDLAGGFTSRTAGPPCAMSMLNTNRTREAAKEQSKTLPLLTRTLANEKNLDQGGQQLTAGNRMGQISQHSDKSSSAQSSSAHSSSAKSVDRPRSLIQSQKIMSRWQKYLPSSVRRLSCKTDENTILMRSLTTPPVESEAMGALNRLTHAATTIGAAEEKFPTPPDDVWTGRGLVVNEAELRKNSIFDSPDRSSDSSSRGSYALIEPKATSIEFQNVQAASDNLSQTPLPQTNILICAPATSPKLLTLTEGCLLPNKSQSATPQLLQTCTQPKPRRVLPSIQSNNSRFTPIYPSATPSSFVSPPNTFIPMAPRRRGNVGRAAILQGITTGSAQFIDAIAKRYGDELNANIPIPSGLAHLFTYTSSSCVKPITLAVKASSSELVRGFIEADADIFQADSGGRTLLHQMFLPLPSNLEPPSAEDWPQPYRQLEFSRPSLPMQASPRSSVLQTPRINDEDNHIAVRTRPGRCRLLEAAQMPWTTNMDNRATIVELLVCAGLSPSIRDSSGKYASDYAREWLWQAHRELGDAESPQTDKISACCVRAAALSLLTLEDYLRLSYLAPLTTNYRVRRLIKPRLDFVVDGRHVMICSSMLKESSTPDRILPLVRGKTAAKPNLRQRKLNSTKSAATDPLVLFLSFCRRHKDHPGPLRILEFLGAAFGAPSAS